MSASLILSGDYRDHGAQQPCQQQQQLLHQQAPLHSVLPYMLIEDEVHGVIELPSHIQEIVEHPLFQRLKKIHQLGLVAWVIAPHANQKRYDHCLGTYKSAQEHLRAIERNSKYETKLPDWCRKAVEIAALLHDIGHGPMSHAWEKASHNKFNHEENALDCVDRIFNDARHPELVALRDEGSGRGVRLIKALILGDTEYLNFPMMGHAYIFDIVHNNRCGLDVDKWDYLRRDNKRLKILGPEEMDFDNIFLKSRISQDGQRIEYRYDDYHRIYTLFAARARLHVEAYQHPKNAAAEKIFVDLVQRLAPQMFDLRSKDAGWLNLDDDHILEMVKNDPMAAYIREPQRVVELPSLDCLGANALPVSRIIEGPGSTMKPDKAFALYGDKRKKRKINRCLSATTFNKCFTLE
ncbi:deoxynucleoside triphosphate triphosphohydrolase SAMHD1 homolog isoform X1 [Drosophila pseudoobscura]|uniref:Deoxynucleoside triphosphate triphosphohydrolase SAMHD1 homolog isoform X1 n=1 Tax=Drosophila pseudoobscura pseudoobscura TaxID=46245 RepID=A0A6I8UBU9_DROPS|nr:deoxynucleoside triphosphate triphosphohydrolase SAMHD1 homolog isoform X1 [Drosophila pseudoobscura]